MVCGEDQGVLTFYEANIMRVICLILYSIMVQVAENSLSLKTTNVISRGILIQPLLMKSQPFLP